MAAKDCIDEIVKALEGRKTRAEVIEELQALDEDARSFEQAGGSYGAAAYSKAGERALKREAERASLRRREERDNAGKAIAASRYIKDAFEGKLSKDGNSISPRLSTEAMFNGVN